MAKFKVCLDAGHYGKYNQSPVNKTYYESVMNWKLHLLVKDQLERYGVEVITTRPKLADDLSVYSRGNIAEGCDLFISFHSNACGTESVDYPVVYRAYDNLNDVDKIAIALAKKVAEIMGTRQDGRTAIRKNSSGGEYYGVLRGARAAGVKYFLLIEHSFHTNKAATNWLLDDNNLVKMAKAEVDLIASFYGLTVPVKTPAPPKTDVPSSFVKGDKAKVKNAIQYNGKSFKVWYDLYDVLSVKGDQVVIGIGNVTTATVNAVNLERYSTKPVIKKGGKVKVKNAVQYDGKPFKLWYEIYDVLDVSGDKIVIGIGKTVTAAVKADNLIAV